MSDKQQLIRLNPLPDETTNALLRPAANSIGTAAGDILDGLFNWALFPLRKYNIVKETDLHDFAKKTSNNIEEIPEEHRDKSKMGIALKALEDSRYQLDQEQMRQYFANLIAKSLDSRINSDISPKFSEILANMTIREANTLKVFNAAPGKSGLVPSIKVSSKNVKTLENFPLIEDVLLVKEKHINNPLEISLLRSSNLIEFYDGSHLTSPIFKEQYEHYENNMFQHIKTNNIYKIDLSKQEYTLQKNFFSLTKMGHSFCNFIM